MVTKKKGDFDVPLQMIKEVQHLLTLVVIDHLILKDSMKLNAQLQFCFQEYHGSSSNNNNDDHIGQAVLFWQGRLHYAQAFDETTVNVVQQSTSTNKTRTLKTSLTQDTDCLLHIGLHLTIDVIANMSKSSQEKIKGRQIKQIGELAKKIILKATAFADAYTKNTVGGPSGSNLNDLYIHVLDQMYQAETTAATKNDTSDEAKESADEEQEGSEKTVTNNSATKGRPT